MNKKEREFLRILLSQDAKIKRLYSETVNSVAGDLKKFNLPKSGIYTPDNIWVRNKAIEASIDKKLVEFHSQFTSIMSESRAEVLGISKESSDQIIKSYLSRMPISQIAKEGIFSRSLEAFASFEKKGLQVSERVWSTAQVMKDQLALYGSSGVASGQPARKIATDLKDFLQHPDKRFRRVRDPRTGKLVLSEPAKNFHPGQGVYRSSYQNGLRLAQSEINMAFRHADQYRWKEMPFITGYEVRLSPNHPEPDICDDMAGEYPKTFLYGGWHPKCICFTVPILSDKKDFISYLKGGELNSKMVTNIPNRAQQYVQTQTAAYKRWTNKPYFLKDNFTLKDGKYNLKNSVTNVKVISSKELLKSA